VAADLGGKVALVTGVGAAGQIGHAVALGMSRAGANVVAVSRSGGGELPGARTVTADLATPAGAARAVQEAVTAFGGLDIVVNVAGGLVNFGPIAAVTADSLERELAANVKTTFFVSQAALPVLQARGGGAIVNFASVAAWKSLNQMAAYSAAKSAVAGLTRALARETRDLNIRVNAIAPATVRTASNVAQMKNDPKAKFVELDEVVSAVLFLVSDAATAITGQILPVTGKEF
jgi:NAD(P)-dependent dehydrogenase (short-subunit alcohol dehydrogenase family)